MNNAVLYASQAIFIMIVSVDITFTGLVGNRYAPYSALATLPFALITLMTALSSIFVPLSVKLFRERASFTVGSCFALLSGLLAFFAIQLESFFIFCVAASFVGIYQAFGQYYRLAAADATPEVRGKGTVVSRIVLFGVIGSLVGPVLLRRLIDTETYGGISQAYLLTSLLASVTLALFVVCYRNRDGEHTRDAGDQEAQLFYPYSYITAVSSSATGYAVMMLTMTAVPIAMVNAGFDIRQSAFVMQAHLIAMFATALASGWLINRVGEYAVIAAGIVFAASCCTILMLASTFGAFLIAMVLVGVGWNFMFVAGTSLVSKSYPFTERFGYQSIAEFTVFGFAAAGALGAGWILNALSWYHVNLMALPLLAVPLSLMLLSVVVTEDKPGITSG